MCMAATVKRSAYRFSSRFEQQSKGIKLVYLAAELLTNCLQLQQRTLTPINRTRAQRKKNDHGDKFFMLGVVT